MVGRTRDWLSRTNNVQTPEPKAVNGDVATEVVPRRRGHVLKPSIFGATIITLIAILFVAFRSGDEGDFNDGVINKSVPQTTGSIAQADTEVDDNGSHPIDPALEVARKGLKNIRENVRDYTATIVKREQVGGKVGDYQYMEAKVRNRKVENRELKTGFAVYLKFIKPKSSAGREVIWVENENDGKLIAHEGGLLNIRRWKLDPTGLIAMLGQRYPIGQIGIENLVEELIVKGEDQRKHGECSVKFYENAKVDDRVCTMIEVIHPTPREHFEFYRARIFIDDERNVPLRYAAWSWPTEEGGEPVLLEEYTYQDLKLNVGLTNKDFDPDNAEYNYP